MSTGIGWIDFSSEHRDRVRSVLDLFADEGVVDELGIGVIRDAFADFLFPGISTIQTRAKYFLTVPRILKDYDQLSDRQRQRTPLSGYLSESEKQVRIRLVQKYGKRDGLGIIGVSFGTSSDRDVLRQPSSVYWNGLKKFKILKTGFTLAEFEQKRSGHRSSLRVLLQETRDERGDDVDADDLATSPIAALPPTDDWMSRLSITLSKDEAEFLRQQMTATVPNSLLGQVLLSDRALEEFLGLHAGASFADLAGLPFIDRLSDPGLRKAIRQAQDFWDLLLGAHIRYNCLLQERFGDKDGRQSTEEEWTAWQSRMATFAWADWNTDALWEFVAANRGSIKPYTRFFVEQWIAEAMRRPASTSGYDQLVIRQERANKRGRARLRPDNRDESVVGWVGIRVLDYRMTQAGRIVNDIFRAETGKADASAGL